MKMGVIITGKTPDDPVLWVTGDEDQLRDAGKVRSLGAVPELVGDSDQLFVILPGHKAATRRLHLPVKGERALEDAAALAFEDILAEPVDGFHFAFGPVVEDGTRLVSAVPEFWLEEWMDALEEAHLDPDVLTLDHLCLHAEGYVGVLLQVDDFAMAALPKGGLSGEASFVSAIMGRMDDTANVLTAISGKAVNGRKGQDSVLTLVDHRALGAFYLTGLSEPVPSFRRGAFQKRHDWRGIARAWRVAGALMAACFAVWLLDVAATGFKHDREASRLTREATAEFSRAYPDVVVRDLRRQAQQRVASGPASTFLLLSGELTEALENAASVQLTRLRYTPDNELVADLRFPDAASLERLKSDLEAQGVQTREGSNLRREENGDFAGQLYLVGA